MMRNLFWENGDGNDKHGANLFYQPRMVVI